MSRTTCAVALVLLAALPAAAQQNTPTAAIAQQELDNLTQAQATLHSAEQAGAPQYAKSLYDEATYNIQFAQQNWNANKKSDQDAARLRAVRGLWAARAALAKARWLGTNAAIRSLQSDITRFGGRADVALLDEPSDAAMNHGSSSRDRINFAQAVVDAAKAAGGEQIAPDDLRTAQADLDSARKIASANANSDSADFLSYIAEMMARRALYTARANAANANLAPLQLQRTQLAQAESERSAATEREQREAAERQQQQLQQQLALEQANRQAQQAELDRLHAQVDETRRAERARIESDRAARTSAEQQLDAAYAKYASALATGSPNDIEAARREMEDLQIAVRAAQQREQMNETSLSGEIDRLRSELQAAQTAGSMSAQVLSERQADILARQQQLEMLRTAREQDVAARTRIDQERSAAITAAQQRRAQVEAQQQEMEQRMRAAQQAAEQAAAAAAAAQQQTQQLQQQQQQMQQQMDAQQQQAQQAQAQAQQQAQQAQAQAQQTAAELERTRAELAAREAEARNLRMQQELARLAATKAEQRGLVVTLPGIFFDTGKSTLKAGAKNTLGKIAEQLKGNSDVRIAIEGHTDSVGSDEKNMQLSEKRASAVRDFLVNNGVPADRVTAAGKGEADPVASNKTAAGRLQNRRVELVITTARS
jgi:outer membrane protein OmpA-like peptidoglycan-associated protein